MEKLGIQPLALLTQAINFAILFFVLSKFLYKPISTALEARRKKIAEGLAYTEKMQKEMEKIEKKKTEILAKAREEAKGIVEEMKKSVKQTEAELIQEAQKEAAAIVTKGKKDVELARLEGQKELSKNAVEIAHVIVTKLLSDVMSEKDQKRILDQKLSLIAKSVK